MITARHQALIRQAVTTYPTMQRALLSAMRTHQRNDEPAREGTAPASMPLSLGCILAVRMSDEPGALDLAETLLIGGIAMQRGMVPAGAGVELSADVLRRLEEGGVI